MVRRIVVLLFVFVFCGCGKKNSVDESRVYPEGMRTAFLDNCVASAGAIGKDKAKAYCACSLDKLQAKFSIKEFVKLAGQMDGEVPPAEMIEVISPCLPLITGATEEPKKEEPPTSVTGAANDPNRTYPDGMRTAFLDNCVGSAKEIGEDRAKKYCACSLKELETRFTIEEFVKIAGKMQGDTPPPEMMDAIKPCLPIAVGGEKSAGTGEAKTGSTPPQGGYPEAVRKPYLDNCIKSGASMGKGKATSYCNCTIDKIEAKFSLEDFLAMAAKMNGGEIPDELMAIIKSCL